MTISPRAVLSATTAVTLTVTLGATATTAVEPAVRQAEVPAPPVVLEDGMTAPTYDYADAIRESVWVQGPDFDGDGEPEQVAVDIVRPAELDGVAEVPVVMMASPYFTCCGRGNEGERKTWDEDGNPALVPTYLDNYFVPRGYAYVAVDLAGTSRSTGCVDTGGESDVLSAKAAVDWLNGRAEAVDAEGMPVTADWSNGRTGMIGKSYDGTIANGVAATGVEGLETIVPIGAISSWYDYTRSQDLPYSNGYAPWLANYVMRNRVLPQDCSAVLDGMRAEQDDESGQYNAFWAERDYRDGTLGTAEDVEASVYVVHGLQDNNVKTRNFAEWWEALDTARVDRKMWLMRVGHAEPFDTDREAWTRELNRWFDSELMGIDNGIFDEPAVRVEVAPEVWQTSDRWPLDRRTAKLRPQADGTMAMGRRDRDEVSFVNSWFSREAQLATNSLPDNQLFFATGRMTDDVRLSGTPELELTISHDQPVGQVTAYVVDYGTAPRVSTAGEGIRTLSQETCWGSSIAVDDACYREVERVVSETPLQVVARGWARLDGPGTHELTVELQPNDVLVKEGHHLGLVITGAAYGGGGPTPVDYSSGTYTVDLADTILSLPVDGPMTGFNRGALKLPPAEELPTGTVDESTTRQRPTS